MTEEIAELRKDSRDSVEISKNAKGEYSWKIKRYYDATSQNYGEIVQELIDIDTELKENFG